MYSVVVTIYKLSSLVWVLYDAVCNVLQDLIIYQRVTRLSVCM